jgi:succinoglycan biosynthesis protein ExoM
MKNKATTILVSICTYKRTELLQALLDSLLVAKVQTGMEISIVVVDNDVAESSKSLCNEYGLTNKVKYFVESERNISIVRNVGLTYANKNKFDYVLFLDDDEYICKDYFKHMQGTIEKLTPDVVIGPVITLYHQNTPSWITSSKAFERGRRETGTIVNTGNTGNALVSVNAVSRVGLFNPEYGRSGGEDSDFFYRCKSNGLSMVWCDEAEVYEYLEMDRCSLKYLMIRARRGGQTYSKIRKANLTLLQKIGLGVNAFIFGLTGLFIAGFLVFFSSKKNGVPLLKKSIGKISQIEGLFGKSVKMYGE